MEAYDAIMTRRTTRSFADQPVDSATIDKLLQAAIMAPSGKNGQPWKFFVIQQDAELRAQVAALSVYQKWLANAPCFVAVFLDRAISYDRMKDTQAIGASIENLLLAAHAAGLGSCWVGEVVKKEAEIKALLGLEPPELEFMALIALGYAEEKQTRFSRKPLEDALLGWK